MTALFEKLLAISMTASWIVLAVMLLRLVLKPAPKWVNCLLWAIVALRLVLPVVPQSELSLVPRTQSVLQTAQVREPVSAQAPETLPEQEPVQQQEPVEPLQIAAWLWLGGMGVLLAYSGISYLRLRWQVQASLRYRDNVYLCDQVRSPFVLGVLRPRIYVPSGMEEDQLQHILAHENAHIRRRDHWWKPLGFVLLAVYWYNPLLWVAYILLCRDIECACDEKVVAKLDEGEKKQYSETLLACSIHRRMVLACPVAFGEMAVKTRIQGVKRYKKPALWLLTVSLVACAVAAVCLLTDPKDCKHEYSSQVLTESTCSQAGTERLTCALCQDSFTRQLPRLSHSYGEGRVTLAAACVHTGTRELTCTACGAAKTEEIPINHAHTLTETVVKAATCTQEGEGVRKCSRCDYQESCTYPVKEHSYVNGTVLTESTCSIQGQMQQYCTGCGRQRVITMATNDVHSWHGSSAKSYEWCANCDATRSKSDGGQALFGSTTGGPFTGQSTGPGAIVWDTSGSMNPTKDLYPNLNPMR